MDGCTAANSSLESAGLTLPKKVLKPSQGWIALNLHELWAYRELLYFLVWRDVKVRYKQTILGAGWAILQPFFTMVVFSLFFGRLAKMPSDGIPYPLFAFAGLVPWMFFGNAVSQASESLVSNSNLIKKVYFPRLNIPLAAVLSGLVDFSIGFGVLLALTFWYGVIPTPMVVFVPIFIILALVTALGVTMWLSALNVQYRDVRYVIPFLVQFWMFATPVAYPSSLLSEPWKSLYGLNPMVGVVEGIRWALLGTNPAPGPLLLVSGIAAVTVLVTGAYYFKRMEKSFADKV